MRATPHARERAFVFVFFAFAFVAFTCVFPFVAAVNNPNENVRTYMTMALVEDHTFKIDKVVARYGWVNDMAKAPDKKTGESHLYSVKSPAVSYAGVPIYWVFTKIAPKYGHPVPKDDTTFEEKQWWFRNTTLVLRLFTIQLPCFAFLVWFERWLRGVSGDVVLRLCAVAAAGLGTNYLAYANMFASHAPFACAAFLSFAIVAREPIVHPDPAKRRVSRAFWAGAFAGLATLLEYHAAPVSAALGIYALTVFWRPLRLVAFGLGAAINAGALMFFQWRCFGSPFTPGHRMSENPAFAAILNQGFFGIGKPSFQVLSDVSLSHAFGFFGTSPFMWLGFLVVPFGLVVGVRRVADRSRRRGATIAWLLVMLVLFVTVSAAANWRGGWTIGPRYLGAAPPFFAYGAVCALEEISAHAAWRRLVARSLAAGCAAASVVQSGLVSILFNTIPESVTRPLPQIVVPFAKTGFVPHHAGELFGWMTPTFWYVVAGCVLAAALLAALVPRHDGVFSWTARLMLAAAVFRVAIAPAFSEPQPWEDGDGGVFARQQLTAMWEPPGRDRITTLRKVAEVRNAPCLWLQLADLERLVDRTNEAAADEKRAGGTPRGVCR